MGGWLVCQVMLSSKRLLVREASLSGDEVSLPTGKQSHNPTTKSCEDGKIFLAFLKLVW